MVLPVWKRSDSFLETSVYILMQHLSLLFSPEKSEMRVSKVCKDTHRALFIHKQLTRSVWPNMPCSLIPKGGLSQKTVCTKSQVLSESVFGESQTNPVIPSKKLALPGSRWDGGNGLQMTPSFWAMESSFCLSENNSQLPEALLEAHRSMLKIDKVSKLYHMYHIIRLI